MLKDWILVNPGSMTCDGDERRTPQAFTSDSWEKITEHFCVMDCDVVRRPLKLAKTPKAMVQIGGSLIRKDAIARVALDKIERYKEVQEDKLYMLLGFIPVTRNVTRREELPPEWDVDLYGKDGEGRNYMMFSVRFKTKDEALAEIARLVKELG